MAVLKGAKAFAAMRGRDFVTPDDVISVVPSVLRHRILLTPEKEMEGLIPDDVIQGTIRAKFQNRTVITIAVDDCFPPHLEHLS